MHEWNRAKWASSYIDGTTVTQKLSSAGRKRGRRRREVYYWRRAPRIICIRAMNAFCFRHKTGLPSAVYGALELRRGRDDAFSAALSLSVHFGAWAAAAAYHADCAPRDGCRLTPRNAGENAKRPDPESEARARQRGREREQREEWDTRVYVYTHLGEGETGNSRVLQIIQLVPRIKVYIFIAPDTRVPRALCIYTRIYARAPLHIPRCIRVCTYSRALFRALCL